jgi:Mn2+/Fe2+ NRAMP family transporter
MNASPGQRWAFLGPGLIFAATSVGISHLVQSTRAGALYGLALAGVVVLANVVKYPAFRFGSDYAAATGMSLLEGYRRQGPWALWFFAAATFTMGFLAGSAIALLVAGLLVSLLGLDWSPPVVGAGVMVVSAAILISGQYRWLERILTLLIFVIAVTTLVAAVLVLPDVRWESGSVAAIGRLDAASLIFIAALVGFMPSPMDASVWQSLWTRAKARAAGRSFPSRSIRLDFVIGYTGAVMLALCFVVLGAGLIHSRGISVESSAGAFAGQLIGLYAEVLGEWTRPLIAIGAIAIMYSSLLAGLDAVPRSLAAFAERLRRPESSDIVGSREGRQSVYVAMIVAMVAGAIVFYVFFLQSLLQVVDISATVAFLSAPVLAFLNHRCMYGAEVPADRRPSSLFMWYSALSAAVMAVAAAGYLYIRFLA